MDSAPKGLRLHIGLFGRTNAGKSSVLNMIAGQDVAIVSPVAGTTTDVVEKTMELLPLGPVVFLDTAGLDDISELGSRRVERTMRALDRADIALLVAPSGVWGDVEEDFLRLAAEKKKPAGVLVTKTDLLPLNETVIARALAGRPMVSAACLDPDRREGQLRALKEMLLQLCPEGSLVSPTLLGDLLPPGGLAVMVVPVDLQAPKGRLILPQVQALRDALDNDAAAVVVKEREYASLLGRLGTPPDLVVCDSQAVMKVVADTPVQVKVTTFSILMARFKADLPALAAGAARVERLSPGDAVLVAESCSHHAAEDDIGRVKIPRWLRQYVGGDLTVDHCAGRDYPADLGKYRLIVHCGSCMLTRGEMLLRLQRAAAAGVPVTNYGVAISLVQGVLRRVLAPFPAALAAYEREKTTQERA